MQYPFWDQSRQTQSAGVWQYFSFMIMNRHGATTFKALNCSHIRTLLLKKEVWFNVNYSWLVSMQNIQNPWPELVVDTVLCSYLLLSMYVLKTVSTVFLVPLKHPCMCSKQFRPRVLYVMKLQCFINYVASWCHDSDFQPKDYQRYHKKYFDSLRKAKIKLVTCSLICFLGTPEFWSEEKIPLREEKKILLDLSCMLEGKRKGRWKRPSFQNINMIHAITTGSQTQLQ